jgi:molybdopterin/thiamine biosynthesis adenylyltransferase
VNVIHEADSAEIAKKYDQLLGNIFITALSSDIWPYRYIQNRDTLSSHEQKKLSESTVAVIGCGGLGGHVLLMLSRIGIGSMVVVDPDIFDETNLNRQVFALSDTIGMYKTDAAVSAIRSVNPAVVVKGFQTAINYANALEIINGADVVVDALDNLPDRKMLQQVTYKMKLPLVHGAIAGFEGQVLSISPDDKGFGDLFGNGDDKQAGCGVSAESIMGVPSITPVFIASLQAMEVVKILLKRGKVISGRMLYSDIEVGEFNYFDFKT